MNQINQINTKYLDVKPHKSALTNPSTILLAVEWIYWSKSLGFINNEFIENLEPIKAQNPTQNLDNSRFLRIWSTVSSILDSLCINTTEIIIEKLTEKLREIKFIDGKISGELLDDLVSLCILSDHAQNHKRLSAQASNYIKSFINLAILNKDAYAFAISFSYGQKVLKENSHQAWLKFYHSMWSQSLPFGWLSLTTSDLSLMAIKAEIAALQLALSLIQSGILSPEMFIKYNTPLII